MFKDFISHQIYHYNHKRFWKWRSDVIAQDSKQPKIVRLLKLIYLKRSEAFNNAYLGTALGGVLGLLRRQHCPITLTA